MKEIRTKDLPFSLVEKMEGPEPPDDFISNGCSCSPDYIGGVDIRPACHFHDFAYERGGCKKDRALADYEFYRNLRKCDLSKVFAWPYFRYVRLFGVSAFNWNRDKIPRNPWHYVCLFFGGYWRW